MGKAAKIMSVTLLAILIACVSLTPAFAAEGKKSLKKATGDAAKATVNYPANLLNESVTTVGTAAKNTAGIVVNTVKATGETLTGDASKAPEIITTPINESVTTVKEAVVDTVKAPIEAGKTTVEQNQ